MFSLVIDEEFSKFYLVIVGSHKFGLLLVRIKMF